MSVTNDCEHLIIAGGQKIPASHKSDERPNRQPHREQLARGVVAGRPVPSTCADNQEADGSRLRHLSSSLFRRPQATDAHSAYCPSDSEVAPAADGDCSTVIGGVPAM